MNHAPKGMRVDWNSTLFSAYRAISVSIDVYKEDENVERAPMLAQRAIKVLATFATIRC